MTALHRSLPLIRPPRTALRPGTRLFRRPTSLPLPAGCSLIAAGWPIVGAGCATRGAWTRVLHAGWPRNGAGCSMIAAGCSMAGAEASLRHAGRRPLSRREDPGKAMEDPAARMPHPGGGREHPGAASEHPGARGARVFEGGAETYLRSSVRAGKSARGPLLASASPPLPIFR
jgi:hypothetical protein